MAFLDLDGLSHLVQWFKGQLGGKVDKVEGKQLSSNDYTTAEKNKLAGLSNYSHPTTSGNKHIPAGGAAGKILGWASDGTAQWVDDKNTTYSAATQSANGLMSAADKKKLDGFGAASSYATMTYVGQQISAAGHISKSIVETLPAVKDAKDNVIYMIKKATPDGSNLYDEYMLISGALEKIGDTKTVIEAITNTQIDTILAS